MACLGVLLLSLSFHGCSEEALDNPAPVGTALNLYVGGTQATTRLGELPSLDKINELVDNKNHIGLYVYYQDDYSANNLTKPYIRNLECKIEGSKLVPVDGSNIYIYDRMTIVAFYPYNKDFVHDFAVQSDETEYPITESDYENQTYIPYRAQANVNPTNAYYVRLDLIPQQTFKVEVVLVANDPASFPTTTDGTFKNGDIKILPGIDPRSESYTSGVDRREFWVDRMDPFTPDGGGQHVRRYNAFIWKSTLGSKHHDGKNHDDNKIEKGDLLFQSKELTLVVPESIDFGQRIVYRYGYNMDTGEIFIPTSENLVYDAKSLQATASGGSDGYQVCDIDLKAGGISNWTPPQYYMGTYDGGGHAIKNLVVDAAPTTNNPDQTGKQGFGLFGSVIGQSVLKNINLVAPSITVDFTNAALKDTCYVGGLCGIANPTVPEDIIKNLVNLDVPPEVTGAIREALLDERLKNYANTTSVIRGCKVSDPHILIDGENVIAGGLCGEAGNQKNKASIYDSYVAETAAASGLISVNADTEEVKTKYSNVMVGSFCGLLGAGDIKNSYSAMFTNDVTGFAKVVIPGTGGGQPTVRAQQVANGFCNILGGVPTGTVSVSGAFTQMDNTTNGVTCFTDGWPAWPLFESDATSNGKSKWPALSWTNSWAQMGNLPSTYPTLIWEHPLYIENK